MRMYMSSSCLFFSSLNLRARKSVALFLTLCLLLCGPVALYRQAQAMPQFAREYGLPCRACHEHIPKLNATGEQFVANGYRMPGLERKPTLPLTLWASEIGQYRAGAGSGAKAVLNRAKLVSAGPVGPRGYTMMEWNPAMIDFQSDGSTRDTSGRFEDLFFGVSLDHGLGLQVGQFRIMSQIDESGKVFLTDPPAFAASVPGRKSSDARTQSLNGFAPSGRSPAIRLTKHWPKAKDSYEGAYVTAAAVFPGEASIPTTDLAQETADARFESSPKGFFVEAYEKRGLGSFGVHGFVGNNARRVFGVLGQRQWGQTHVEAGLVRAEWSAGNEWRSDLSVAWIPSDTWAMGIRADQRHVAGEPATLAPLASFVFPIGAATGRFILEGRIRQGAPALWLLEFRVLY